MSAQQSSQGFANLMASPGRLMIWNSVVHIIIVLVVARGVQAGIERAVKVLMPILFVALLAMVLYGLAAGDMAAASSFLLQPDFSKVNATTVMSAIGQAFFSIGIGMASLIAFGAYLPDEYSIPRSATAIIFADTAVALVAGFAIFPLVFQFGLEPSGGSGLTFVTLPVAFGQMDGGVVFGTVFFVLLLAAALSSCIGCAEAVGFWLTERFGISRRLAVVSAAIVAWTVGLSTIFSLSAWSDFHPLGSIPAARGMNLYAATDFLAANILLLAGGLLVAVFFGWQVPRKIQLSAIGAAVDGTLFRIWLVLIRWVIPPALFVALILGLRS